MIRFAPFAQLEQTIQIESMPGFKDIVLETFDDFRVPVGPQHILIRDLPMSYVIMHDLFTVIMYDLRLISGSSGFFFLSDHQDAAKHIVLRGSSCHSSRD